MCRDISSIEGIIDECKSIKPDLIVIGPENYLSENLAGKLRGLNFNVFGPDELGAKLESSKEFMKEFCKSHNIPTAKSETFTSFDIAKKYLTNTTIQSIYVTRNKSLPDIVKNFAEEITRFDKSVELTFSNIH